MKRLKLKESDLRKIIQRTINESQLLLEEEAICDRGVEQCNQCREVLIKAGVGGAIGCICEGQGCWDRPGKTDIDTDVLPAPLSPKKQMGESYRRRNYRKY
jgi:hypothetical protein